MCIRDSQNLSRHEGIIPALESSHALAYALQRAEEAKKSQTQTNILVSLSGRGDKDIAHIRQTLEVHPEYVVTDDTDDTDEEKGTN